MEKAKISKIIKKIERYREVEKEMRKLIEDILQLARILHSVVDNIENNNIHPGLALELCEKVERNLEKRISKPYGDEYIDKAAEKRL